MNEILIENQQSKKEILPEIDELITLAVEESLKYEDCDFAAQVSVTIVDNEEIRDINREHRDIDKATDVLSFPMLEFDEEGNAIDCDFDLFEDGRVLLWDLVISAERAKEQAEEFGHSFEREMAFLTVHSMLHLLGYDHVDDPEGERIMIEKQKEILDIMGIKRE